MDKKFNKLNLEIALFTKEIERFAQNNNEFEDETGKLLMKTVRAINSLRENANVLPTSSTNVDGLELLDQIDGERIACRRHIVCLLCHEQIRMSRDDFEDHLRTPGHQEKEIEFRSRVNGSMDSVQLNSRTNQSAASNTNNAPSKGAVDSTNSPKTSAQTQFKNELFRMWKTASMRPTPEDLLIRTDFFTKIAIEAKKLISRSEERTQFESRIVYLMKSYLQSIDTELAIVPFGSSTFGFGSDDTDLNMAIIPSNLSTTTVNSIDSIKNHLAKTGFSLDFGEISEISANRTVGKQLRFVHSDSGIKCALVMDDGNMVKSSSIISDFMAINKFCRRLIAYVRAWHNVLLKTTNDSDLPFNTYTIAILVIFFLQVTEEWPTVQYVAKKCPEQTVKKLQEMVYKFFNFYSTQYRYDNHVISIIDGQWQEIIPNHRTTVAPLNESLRMCMQANKMNWRNCAMLVEDIVRSGVNVTADISERCANDFQLFSQINTFLFKYADFNRIWNESQLKSTQYMNNLLKGKQHELEDEIDGAPLNNNRVLTALPELEYELDESERTIMVLANGFPLNIQTKDVQAFFSDSNDLPEDVDIFLMPKDTHVEAYVQFSSEDDRRKALAKNNTKFRSHSIQTSEIEFKQFLKIFAFNKYNEGANKGGTK